MNSSSEVKRYIPFGANVVALHGLSAPRYGGLALYDIAALVQPVTIL